MAGRNVVQQKNELAAIGLSAICLGLIFAIGCFVGAGYVANPTSAVVLEVFGALGLGCILGGIKVLCK